MNLRSIFYSEKINIESRKDDSITVSLKPLRAIQELREKL